MGKQANKPTIRDVAADTGLSIATISAVVNRADWVPDATRLRVERSIDTLGYRPNMLARGLKTRQGFAIGVIVSDVTNPFFTDIVRSLKRALQDHDRNLVLCDSEHEFDLGEKNFRMLLELQVDAMVLIGDSVSKDVLERFLANGSLPIVAIERDYQLEGVNQLLVDSEQAGYEATSHLLEQGFTKIGMITGPATGSGSTTYSHLQSYEGYKRALNEASLPLRDEMVAEGNYQIDGGRQAMDQLLRLYDRPDGVFAANDLMALGAMQAIREFGLIVPVDVGVVGYDDIPMVAHATTPLTTLAAPRKELGEAAADILVGKTGGGGDLDHAGRVFTCQLIVRESSRRLALSFRKSVT
jgi:LacI family transcriptional regulator